MSLPLAPLPPNYDAKLARRIAGALVRHFDRGHREMPWRHTRDPYAIWLSEIMLQQTQVQTVIPYYERFVARFANVAELARAEPAEVLALWSGLGYYRRARHLHEAARAIVERHGGRVPGTIEALRALPGIGRYTAGAIASIAFDQPAPVVDGNVMRVLARVYGYDRDISVARHQEFFWRRAEEMVRATPHLGGRVRYGDVNQAIMELGATVCTPVAPTCGRCPLRAFCAARAEGRQADLPVKAAKKSTPVVRRRALIVLRQRRGGREVLLVQRPSGGLWEQMWEFPTFSRDGSDMARALGVKLRCLQSCGTVEHQLSHRRLWYRVYTARCVGRKVPRLPACDGGAPYAAARWVDWPLAAEHGLPLARLVHKLAACGGKLGAH
jgi:A/G-specific adenine glycosylase